jgi:hypothetical protein
MPLSIRTKPLWMRLFNRGAVIAFFGRVYFPPGLRERLEREDPERLADILDHESIHVGRQHALGIVRWHLDYVLSRRFRWQEEQAAYHSGLSRLRSRGGTLSEAERDRLADRLSGPMYLYMTSRKEARGFIDWVLAK